MGRPTHASTIIYVLGSGHSGSTLLNLLLNGHSQVVGLCEVDSLNQRLLLPESDPLYPLAHVFWRKVAECWQTSMGSDFQQIRIETPNKRQLKAWSDGDHREYLRNNRALLDCVTRVSGASHIVDTSRSRRRLALLSQDERFSFKVVHLVRDGRGVVNSYRRKYGRFRIGLRRWMVPTVFGLVTRKRMRELDWMQLRYEDLAAAPEATLRKLCQFAGIEYEAGMLNYWEQEDISIGGNRMRQLKRPVRLDEKWRREMSLTERIFFTTTGAWLNWTLGYPVLGAYRTESPVDTTIPV